MARDGSEFDKALVGWIKAESGAQTVIAAGALGITRIGFASPYVPGLQTDKVHRVWAARTVRPLKGSTLLIVGLGQTGRAIAAHAPQKWP